MASIQRTALALLATIALTAACGSSGTPAPGATTALAAAAAAAAVEMNIDVQGFKFPPTVNVAKGTKVTWTNKDSTAHTITSGTRPTKDGTFDGQLSAGGTFSFTFTEAGTFNYFCMIHSSMNGTITVR